MYSLEKLDSFTLPLPSANHTYDGKGKWSLSATKNLDASPHRLLVTTDAIFIAFDNSLQIVKANSGEGVTLTRHSSPINALGACAEGLAVSCSNSEILLYHFDSLLKEWEVTPVSEGEGRIFTLSIVVVQKTIFICAFKREEIVIYSADSLHQLCEPGPLILDTISVLATIEKGRETTSHSSAFYREEDHTLCLLAVGSPANLKFWALPLKAPEPAPAQLLKFSSLGIKTMVEFGVFGGKFALLVGSEGTVELYALHSKGFNLLHKMVVEGEGDDWSVVGASIFKAFDHVPFEKEEDTLKPPNPVELPRFLFFILSSQGLELVDAKSGVKFGESLSLQNILGSEIDQVWVQGAGLATDGENELLLVLQPNLLPLLHCSKIKLSHTQKSTENSNEGRCSLLSSEPLNPKSVLRRRIKSPPPPPKRKSKSKPRRAAKPTWATKAKLRVKSAQKIPPPESARSRSCSNDDKPIRLEAKGSYEDNALDFNSAVELGERLSGSQSTIRLAFSGDGRFLSAGGSVSPLVVMKTRPVWNITQSFKEIGKITSLHFNFLGNILLVGCNEGVTRLLDFSLGKELLSFKQVSKFNEQLHSQFYFMDKFILQPKENVVNLYAIKELGDVPSVIGTSRSFIKLQAATFPFYNAQNISALAAANQFLSHQIVTGLSNKSLELFDVNAEKTSLSLPSAHARPVSCIRLNEAPKGSFSSVLASDVILSSAPCTTDPIKLWDLRCAKCVLRISDVNANSFVGNARPALSPCGRFIASGFEENSLVCYDTRKLVGRLSSVTLKSSGLDLIFHPSAPILVAACRNGRLWGFPA